MSTIIIPAHVDPDADAEVIRKACEGARSILPEKRDDGSWSMPGWGTDEEGIIQVIGHRNAGQRKMIKEAYYNKYNEDLIHRLEKELSRHFERAVYRWMLEPFDREAVLIHVALQEKKSDFRIIIELACTSHPDEFLGMKRAYAARYKHSLEEDIASHFNTDVRMLLLLLVSVYRFETDETDAKLAEKEAEMLHDCIKKKEYHHDEIIRIITTRSKMQLIATFYRFKEAYGTPITKSLAHDKDKNFVAALHTAIKCIKAPQKYLERVISDALHKRGTDEDDLTRVIVTRAEKDLAQIKDLFHKKNSVTLEDTVAKETSGDYKKFLLTLLGAKDH